MPFLAPAIAAAGAAIGTGISATFTVAGIVKMVVTLLINVGLALLQMALTKTPKPEDMKQVIRQSTPMRIKHLGRVRVGGPLIFVETKDRVLYQVVYLGEGPVHSFEEFFLDNRSLELDDDGWVTSKPYGSGDNKRVQILTRNGDVPSTVYEPLRQAFPGLVNYKWRGNGLATAYISALPPSKPQYVQKHYPNGLPQFNAIALMGDPYDPRSGARAWTDSMPLMLLEYLTSSDGAGIPLSLFDMDDVIRATRVAAGILATKNGGTERRYHGSMSWSLGERPGDVVTRYLMHMDGWIGMKPNGLIGIKAGEWIEPTVHILDRQILDAEIKDGSSPISEANEIVIKWTNPNANYSEATSDPWRNEANLAKAGGKYKNTTVELFGIQNHNHARRIAKILDQKTNPRWTGWIRTTLAGMQAWDQRFIRISYADLNIVAQAVEVMNISVDEEDLTVTITFSSVESTLYDFNPATEEGTPPVDPAIFDESVVPLPAGFEVEWSAETVKGKRVITGTLSVDRPKRGVDGKDADDIKFEFQYARADYQKWRETGGITEEREIEIEGLVEMRLYDFRVRQRAAVSEPGTWVVLQNQRAIDPDAPSRPTKVRASTIVGVAAGEIAVSVTAIAPTDAQTAALRLYRDDDATAKGSSLITEVACAPGETVALVDPRPKKGARWYFVRAVNGSEIASAAVPAVNNPVRL